MFNFGILGINARNLHYIGKHNPAKAVRLADNKITTKEFLSERGIPVPETYAVIKNRAELMQFDFFSIPHTYFIIKPARGSRGRGIYRVKQNKNDELFEVQGKEIEESMVKTYCYDILEGKESLQNKPDDILIEEMLIPGDGFEEFCEHGLADIRLIVYNFVPVAAMLRVPTEESGGKANLDRGGVGLGVEVGSGKVLSMHLNGTTYKKEFPDQYASFQGMKLSYREDILHWSTQIQWYVNLGYLALDWVITDTGPKLLEINARAGLKIQLALDLPLRERLEKVGSFKVHSPEKGVEICQTLFSTQRSSFVSTSKILPQHSYGTVISSLGSHHEVTIDIDLNKTGVIMDPTLSDEFAGVQSGKILRSNEQNTLSFKDRKKSPALDPYHILLGHDAVAGFLIKPTQVRLTTKQTFHRSQIVPQELDMLHALDLRLAKASSKLIFSRYCKPVNFLEEFDTFLEKDGAYNPTFVYQRPTTKKLEAIGSELSYIREEFRGTQEIESTLGSLFEKKLEELITKQQLLLARKNQDAKRAYALQEQYRGPFREELFLKAQERIATVDNNRKDLGSVLGRKRIIKEVLPFLQAQGWGDVEVKFTPETFARMSVKKYGSRLVLQISSASTFRKHDLFAAIAHELMHLRRWTNGSVTGRNILKSGTAGYLADEEGLAIRAAEQELPDAFEKVSMRNKYALVGEAKKHTFEDLVVLMREDASHKSLLSLFKTAFRLKRGREDMGAVSEYAVSLQDTIYAAGYDRISTWIEDGGRMHEMMVGKIGLDDLEFF